MRADAVEPVTEERGLARQRLPARFVVARGRGLEDAALEPLLAVYGNRARIARAKHRAALELPRHRQTCCFGNRWDDVEGRHMAVVVAPALLARALDEERRRRDV